MPEGTQWPVAVGSPILVVTMMGMVKVVDELELGLAPVIAAVASGEVELAPSKEPPAALPTTPAWLMLA